LHLIDLHHDTITTSKHTTGEKGEMGRALANQGLSRDHNENTKHYRPLVSIHIYNQTPLCGATVCRRQASPKFVRLVATPYFVFFCKPNILTLSDGMSVILITRWSKQVLKWSNGREQTT